MEKELDKKTKGAWLVHQTGKLQNVNSQANYENTYFAGKAGILLSAISADRDSAITTEQLETLAKASKINTKFELPNLIQELKKRDLIEVSQSGIEVLGVTTAATLQHTSDIFDGLFPSSTEKATLVLSEECSKKPQDKNEIREQLSDEYSISSDLSVQLLDDSETIGFVDVEKIDNENTLYFNGNLFRREEAQKAHLVLSSLTEREQAKVREISDLLINQACVSTTDTEKILGIELFKKLNSIGLFDVNVVSNSEEEMGYVTKPSAFSKYSNSLVEDAFDLAKAFVSSLTYGMTRSSYERGQIRMIEALLRALIDGRSVGPVDAIANDYKVLELKHVVKVYQGEKKGRHGPLMKLLKKEVGELALEVIQKGDVSEQSLTALPSAVVTNFIGPETNRERARRHQIQTNPKASHDMVMALRTGEGY